MTNTSSPPPFPAFDLPAWQVREARKAELAAQALPQNKAVLFDALAAAGITVVMVFFDGYGDSGQIEEIRAMSGDQPRDFPAGTMVLAVPFGVPVKPSTAECSVRDAVEALAYAFLDETHGGWENDAGAYGEFTFNVAGRSSRSIITSG